jgi:hypothetical protein
MFLTQQTKYNEYRQSCFTATSKTFRDTLQGKKHALYTMKNAALLALPQIQQPTYILITLPPDKRHTQKVAGWTRGTWQAFLPVWRATMWRGPVHCTARWSDSDTRRMRSGIGRRTCNNKHNHFRLSHRQVLRLVSSRMWRPVVKQSRQLNASQGTASWPGFSSRRGADFSPRHREQIGSGFHTPCHAWTQGVLCRRTARGMRG